MGDSITANNEYQTTLDALLNNVFNFVNFGISGDITSNMVNRFKAIVNAAPDYVIILGGVNDIRAANSTASQIESNLQTMYTAAHNSGIEVIALNITPFKNSSEWTVGKQAVQDSVNSWIPTG